MNFATLGEALDARRSSHCAVHFIEGDNAEHTLRFGELYPRALGLLHHFQACGASPGSEMILLVDRNEQFIDAFWACVLGGIIVVPLAPGTTDAHRIKFFRVLEKLKRPLLCTDQKIFSRLAAFASENALSGEIERIKPATVYLDQLDDISQPGRARAVKPDDIAFVQYSSGSTSEPKGVILTHGNLIANITAIARGINLGAADIGLAWMPLTHDMGLIGFHLTPFVMDVTHYLMSTAVFVRRPQLWLAKASEKKATILCSPNFGYRHFLKTFNVDKPPLLDLSQVRILFNGAEPISAEICREFLDALRPHGLRHSAMFPVYGLAEASLAVTFPPAETGYQTIGVNREALSVGTVVEAMAANNPRAVTFMLLGQPVLGCDIRIAGEADSVLPDYTVGHVQIRGDNVSRGYYEDPESTRAAFSADGWLDTGDLGFVGSGGLVITGRAKEILFVSGQNYYPHDIETVIEKHAGIEPGKSAVCGVRPENAATDEVLAFILHRGALRDFVAIANNVRRSVNQHAGIVVSHVIPVGRFPKTTSGKIQRYLLAASYQKGEFEAILSELRDVAAATEGAVSDASTEIEYTLKEICDSFLKDKPIGVHDNIFEFGTSSLTLAQIYQRIEALYPGLLEVTDFFDYPTIAELAKYLKKRIAAA